MPLKRGQIYSKGDYEKNRELQRRLADLLPILDDATQCGIECEGFRQDAEELLRRSQQIQQRFMTPVPRR